MTLLGQTAHHSKSTPVPFSWDDPFLLDEQLTEDERMIRDTARAYAQEVTGIRAFS